MQGSVKNNTTYVSLNRTIKTIVIMLINKLYYIHKRILVILILVSSTIYAQNSWIVELPFESSPYFTNKIIKTGDDGYVLYARKVSGSGEIENYLLKYDTYGNLQWMQTPATTSGNVWVVGLKNIDSNSFILTGGSYNTNDYYQYIMKMDINGETIFDTEIENSFYFFEPTEINNGYAALSQIDENSEWRYVHRFDENGNLVNINLSQELSISNDPHLNNSNSKYFIWKKTLAPNQLLYTDYDLNYLNELQLSFPHFNSYKKTYDGGWIFADEWHKWGWEEYYYVAKVDENLNLVWAYPISDYIYLLESFDSFTNVDITTTQDGGYVLGGNTENNFVNWVSLVKIDANGNKLWQQNYDEFPFGRIYGLEEADDGGLVFFAVGKWQLDDGRVWLVKTASDGYLDTSSLEMAKEGIRIFPNPTNGIVNIRTNAPFENLSQSTGRRSKEIIVTDILGKEISTLLDMTIIDNQISLDFSGQPTGVYFIKLQNANQIWTKKIIKK